MKIATKISSGYAVLILFLLGAFSYQVLLIHRMQTINENLGGLSFSAASQSLLLLQDLDQVEEFTKKLFATGGDPGYAGQLAEMHRAFSDTLREIQGLPLSPEEQKQVVQLAQLWEQALARADEGTTILQHQDPKEMEVALDSQLSLLNDVGLQTREVMRATRNAIPAQVEQAEQAARRAERIFIATAIITVLLGIIASVWIVHSLTRPLRRLEEGTREIAKGQFNYQLEVQGRDELAALARDFNWMTRQLSELDQMKKDFVSHVSHELKTPLASMQETIRLMLDGIPGPLTSQQRGLLELNLQSGRRLSALIANLLDLSRMEAGVMDYLMERNDLVALVKRAVAEIEVPLLDRKLRMETSLPDEPFLLECDGDRVIQVLHNVLGNALKFSPPGSTISVSLTQERQLPRSLPSWWRLRHPDPTNDGFALLLISDQGPGVPTDSKPRIFEKFRQVNHGGKNPGGGTGLGLAISRTIVEVHGGVIWVDDNPGGGSVFSILLPAGELVAQEAPEPPRQFNKVVLSS